MTDLVRIGSETAKGGFANEEVVAEKFKDWQNDEEAQKWLKIMDYNLKEIEKVEAVVLHGYKTDVHVKVTIILKEAISIQNLSVKKANSDADYNQVDKRWVKNYVELWDIPENIVSLLEIFCGKISPKQLLKEKKITKERYKSLRDKRRLFVSELENRDKKLLINFFKKNKLLVVTDILKGRGQFAADWMLVTKHDVKKDETSWVLADINKAMSIFGEGYVKISPRGSISVGRITLQRKGGDGGRETANMLQFKIKPCVLFRY